MVFSLVQFEENCTHCLKVTKNYTRASAFGDLGMYFIKLFISRAEVSDKNKAELLEYCIRKYKVWAVICYRLNSVPAKSIG